MNKKVDDSYETFMCYLLGAFPRPRFYSGFAQVMIARRSGSQNPRAKVHQKVKTIVSIDLRVLSDSQIYNLGLTELCI